MEQHQNMSFWSFKWAYSGVNFSLPGAGGEDCVNFLTSRQKVLETAICTPIAFLQILYVIPRLKIRNVLTVNRNEGRSSTSTILLVLMCLTFGAEIGFKLATQQFIWILNPCHIITIVQIYNIAAPNTRHTTAIFRFQIHCLCAPLLALLFPVTNTRLLPFEAELYYIQHGLMFVVPYFLLREGGNYNVEPLRDYSWAILTQGILFSYYWLVLQGLAIVTWVNLNNMVCPAVSDPFHGPYYRLWAEGHQTLMVLGVGKVYTAICQYFMRHYDMRPSQSHPQQVTSNGHPKLS